jgi:O-antigen/teichoic acid export membrane protein
LTNKPSPDDTQLSVETTHGVVARVFSAGSGLAGTIIFANVLGADILGQYFLLYAIANASYLPIDGWAEGTKKRFSDPEPTHTTVLGVLTIVFVVWVAIMMVLFFALSGLLTSVLDIDISIFILPLLVIEGAFVVVEKLVHARGRVGRATWIDSIRSVITLGFQGLLVYLGWEESGLLLGLSLATIVSLVPLALSVREIPGSPDSSEFRSQWRYARFSVPEFVVGRLHRRAEPLLIGAVLGPAAVGLYEVARRVAIPASFVADVAGNGLMANVSRLWGETNDISEDVENVLSFASILAIPLFTGSLVLSTEVVVTLFGSKFNGAGILLIGVTLSEVFGTQNHSLWQVFNGMGKPNVNLRISTLYTLLKLPLMVLLLYQIGLVGIVVSLIISEAFKHVLSVIFLRRFVSINPLPRLLFEEIVAAIAMMAIIGTIITQWPVTGWQTLLFYVTLGCILYSLFLAGMSNQFRETSVEVLKGLTNRGV